MILPSRVWLAEGGDTQDISDWLTALRTLLIADDDSPPPTLFALIDAARFDDLTLLDAALEQVQLSGSENINIYRDFTGLDFAALGPRLVPLSGQGVAIAAGYAMEEQAFGFLIAHADAESLGKHLSRLIEMRLPDGNRALFRFQDVRVMSALMPLLNPEQLATLLGPVNYWISPEIHGGFTVSFQPALVQENEAPLSLTSEQCDLLDVRLLPHSIAQQVREADAALLEGLTPGEIYDKLYEKAAQARTLGLSLNSDIALFCLLSLQLPAGFECMSPVIEALARVKAEAISFDAALDAIPPQDWQALDDRLGINTQK